MLALWGMGAEVPTIPGCVTQGDTFDELLGNPYGVIIAEPYLNSGVCS